MITISEHPLQSLARSMDDLFRRSSVLFKVAVAHLILLAVMASVAPLDDRLIMGVNPWIKPMKFAISIAIFLLTIDRFVSDLPLQPRARKLLTWGTVSAMSVEMILIAAQAARGVTSHFNKSSIFDAVVFSVMGVAIMVNTLLTGYLAYRSWTTRTSLPEPYLWGIRLGLLIFLLASAEGSFMVSHFGHSVSVPDGGPGLPLINWSTRGGDLRVAHFFGMHALQAVPLVGYLLSRRGLATRARSARWVMAFGLGYGAIALWLFLSAIAGRPLIQG